MLEELQRLHIVTGCLAGGDRLLLCRGLSQARAPAVERQGKLCSVSQDWAGRSHRPECDPSSWWNDVTASEMRAHVEIIVLVLVYSL